MVKGLKKWQINVVLMIEENDVFLITVFPGRYDPPLPSLNFWNKHFLI